MYNCLIVSEGLILMSLHENVIHVPEDRVTLKQHSDMINRDEAVFSIHDQIPSFPEPCSFCSLHSACMIYYR